MSVLRGKIPAEEGSAVACALQVDAGCTSRDHMWRIVQQWSVPRMCHVCITERRRKRAHRQAWAQFGPGRSRAVRARHRLCCVRRGHHRPNQRIAVHGVHEHGFMNPAGVLFHIGCFAMPWVAPSSGQIVWNTHGSPASHGAIAMCGSCGQHLGWHFRQRGKDEHEAFFGLILNRLRQPVEDS